MWERSNHDKLWSVVVEGRRVGDEEGERSDLLHTHRQRENVRAEAVRRVGVRAGCEQSLDDAELLRLREIEGDRGRHRARSDEIGSAPLSRWMTTARENAGEQIVGEGSRSKTQ